MAYVKTVWSNGVTPINANNMNHIEEGIESIEEELEEEKNKLGGTILWQNANPNSSFATQTITLNSSNYDMLEIIAKTWIQTGYQKTFSIRIPKGFSGVLSTVFISDTSTNTLFLGQRAIDYSNDTTYIVGNGYGVNAGYSATQQNNDTLVPLYVIGYKTGLF